MAAEMVEVMAKLGFCEFMIAAVVSLTGWRSIILLQLQSLRF